MSFVGAFTRTGARRAQVLRPVAADKIKWWAKKKACDGEVREHSFSTRTVFSCSHYTCLSVGVDVNVDVCVVSGKETLSWAYHIE